MASWFDDQNYTGAPPQKMASWFDVPGTSTPYVPNSVLTADQYTALSPADKNAYDQQWMSPDQIQRVNQTLGVGTFTPSGALIASPYQATPAQTAAAAPSSSSSSGDPFAMPSINWSDPTQFRQAIVSGLTAATGQAPDDQTINYWMGKWGDLTARGQQLNDPQYAWQRLLGYEAGPGDYAKFGPYAGGQGYSAPGDAGGTIGLNSFTGPQGSFSFPQFSYPGFTQTFTAPTAAEANQNPAEQAQLQLGEQAIQASAAANGNLLTGTTLKGLEDYSSQLAATNYQNVYNNALSQYQNALNTYLANYNTAANQYQLNYGTQSGTYGLNFGVSNTLNQEQFNNQYSVADLGLRAAGASSAAAGQFGTNAAGTVTGAGNAAAAGTVGSANAWSQGLGQVGNAAMTVPYLPMVLGQGPSSPYGFSGPTSSYGLAGLSPSAVPSNSSPGVWSGLFSTPPVSSYAGY